MAGKEVATLAVKLEGSFATFNAQMGQVSKQFDSLGKNVSKIGKTFTQAFTVPLGIVGAAAIAASKQIDNAYDTIRGQTGETGAALESLEGTFNSVFSESVQGAEEVASAIAQLHNGLSLTGKPLEDLAKQATGLAQVTGQELGSTIKGTISVMNAWGVATDKQAETMDFLFKVGQKTNQNVGELAATVASFQPTLQRLGMGLKEGAALFGQLGKNGVDAGKVMGALNIAVSKFAKAGVKDMGAALKLTFEALKNAPNDTKAANDAITIFGKKAGPQLAALVRSGKLSIEEFLEQIEKSPETIGKAVDATDSFGDRLIKFRNAISVALAPLGNPILEQLSEQMKALQPTIESLGKSFAGLSDGWKQFISFSVAGLVVIGPLIKGFAFLFGWVSKLGPVITALGTAFTFLAGTLALLLTPIGLVAAAVGVAIAVWYEWDTVGPMIDEFVDGVVTGFNVLIEMITSISQQCLDSVIAFGQGVGDAFMTMKDNVLTIVQELVNGITEWFTGSFEAAKQSVVTFTDDVKASFEGLYDAVIGHSSVPDLVNGVGTEIQKLDGNMVQPVKSATDSVAMSFESLTTKILSTTKSGTEGGKQLGDAWKKTSQDLKSVMSDLNQDIDPVRKSITELLKNKDFSGLQKMAEGFKGSKEGLDQFRSSLRDAKGDFTEWERNQTALNEKLGDTKKELYELATGKQLIDPLTESITAMMQAGNMDGIEALGRSMQDTAEDSSRFNDALSESMSTMRDMKQAGEELTGSLTRGLSGMFENFGIGGQYAEGLSGILGGLFTGQGKGGFGQLGNLINEQFGGGSIFDSILGSLKGGGSGGGGGGFGGGDIFGSIMDGLGFGGSSQDELGSFFSMSDGLGDLDFSGLSDSTAGLSESMGSLSGSMEGMGSYVSIAGDALESLSLIGKDTKSTFEGGGQLAGAGIGAVFGGPVGAQIGSSVGKVVGSFLGGMFGGKSKDAVARKQVEKFLEDAFANKQTSFFGSDGHMKEFDGNFVFGNMGRKEDGQYADYGQESNKVYDSIGVGLTKVLGITRDVGGQIGKILQENLSGNIDNARILMNELGISQEQMTDAFVAAGEEGSMSWHAVEVALQGVSAAFGEGLVAVGDVSGAFNQIVESGGDGKDAILGIRNAAVEAGEAGVKSFEEWKAALLAAGSDPGYVDAFFAALQSRGLTSLEGIKDATTRVLGGVIADMQSNSTALAAVWTQAQEESQKYADTIAKIPDESTKNVTLNVTANVDSTARQVLDMQGSSSTSSTMGGNVPAFAKGGIVTKPTLGLIGEAGPEAIMPLSSLGSVMSKANMDSVGGGGNVYHIDARGASPGVEGDILRALAAVESRAIQAAVVAVAEQRERGGGFSDSF